MADWIHCNVCQSRPGPDQNKKFFLSSCSDIYCQACIKLCDQQNGVYICKICKNQMQLLEINRQLKPELQTLFLGLKDLTKKQAKQQSSFNSAIEFQEKHRSRLFKVTHEQMRKATKAAHHFKGELAKRLDMEKEMKVKFQQCYEENQDLKNRLNESLKEQKRLQEELEKREKWRQDQFAVSLTRNEAGTYDNTVLSQHFNMMEATSSTPMVQQNPITPMKTPLSAGRITLGLKAAGGRTSGGSGGGSGGRRRTPNGRMPMGGSNSPLTSIVTTPQMLGYDKRRLDGSKSVNPYDNVWQQQSVGTFNGPIQISPRNVTRSATYSTSGGVACAPIKLPFTLNKNT